jgi:hypothetical protein
MSGKPLATAEVGDSDCLLSEAIAATTPTLPHLSHRFGFACDSNVSMRVIDERRNIRGKHHKRGGNDLGYEHQ